MDLAAWWHALKDPELDSLIARAISGNPDVLIALGRLQAARTYEAAVIGTVLPVAEASAAAGHGTGSDLTRGRASQTLISANNTSGLKHLNEIGGGKTYSQLSSEAMALPKGSPAYAATEAKVQTVFQGTTLRGLLLEAYGFSLIATIALWCAIVAFSLAGLLAVLVAIGFWHAKRTDDSEELLPQHAPPARVITA